MMWSILCLLFVCCFSTCIGERAFVPGYDHTNAGNEFFVGFIRNRFGLTDEQESIPPVLWITTKESAPVNFEVFTIFGRLTSDVATPGQVTYINIPLGFVVFDSSEDTETDSRFKGIRIKAEGDRRIVVFGHHEEVASTDAYLALPIILLPAGRSYEYIAASIFGDSGTVARATDSVALIIGTENDTEIILEPSAIISHPFAPALTGNQFIPAASVNFRTVTIQKFQTFYLQVRGGDISGTRIIANKPISVFSGHECANIPLASEPCDILIEQLQPIDTWGTEAVTVPLRTRSGDVLKVFASQNSTTVNVTYTDINSDMVTNDSFSFTLNRNGFRELGGDSLVATGVIDDFALIQSNNPIAVFQFSRSYTTDNNIISDPFMLSVPSCEQYRDSYAVAPAPFNETIEGSITGRVAYVNYTNIAVPVEYFNASLITVNNNTVNASEFRPIRRADNSIWGYGAQLLLDEGAQVIRHQDPNAALSVTLYGFSNQQSWGCIGGTGLALLTLLEPTIVFPDNNSVFTINETDSYSITCNATGIPAPMTFVWLKDGIVQNYTVGTDSISVSEPSAAVPYSTSDGDILSVSQVLTISSAMDEDSGTYTCVASNGVGNNASVFIQLIVQGPPRIIEGPTNKIDDNNVTLTCDAVAFPQHDVTWMFQRIGTNDTRMIISTSSPDPNMKYLINDDVNTAGYGTLTITNLQYSDRGIYTCMASNTHGSDSDNAMVNVHVKPSNQTISGGGRFNISSEVNLTCTVIGVPLPAVVWRFNGINIDIPSDCILNSYNASLQMRSVPTDCLLQQSLNLVDTDIAERVTDPQDIVSLGAYDLSELIVESTLTISSLQRSDNGSYTCNITNMLPETSTISVVTDFTTVVVLERPDPIQNVTVIGQGSRWVLMTWNVPYNGNSEIMGYIVYINNLDSNLGFTQVSTSSMKRQTTSSQFTTTSTSYNVTDNVLPFTRYQFTVVACNELGCGALVQSSPEIQTNSESPETTPLSCVATVINSTAIMVTWSPPVMPNGIITDYTVSYAPGQSLSTADHSNDGNVSVAIGNNGTSTNLSGLRVATNYFIAIAAHTTVGIGPFSSSMDCTAQTLEDVPSGPPLNVVLFSPTSTSIDVNWDLPNPLLRNGIITKHRLNYTEVSQPSSWTTMELNASTSYTIERLKIFTQYYVSVSAGTQIIGFGPFSPPEIYQTLNDTSSAPRNPQVIAIDKTTLQLQWMEPEILNGIIIHYRIYYKPIKSYSIDDEDLDTSTRNIDTPDDSRGFTITGLISATNYTVYLSAFTEAGEGNISVKITSFTSFDEINTAIFQLRLKPIGDCEEWAENDREQKQNDIKAEIVQEVVKRCSCEFNTNNIIDYTFSCRGSQGQFRNTVVYRGMITLQVPPPVTDADDIITEMSDWVQTEPSVIVNGVTLYLDPSCPVMLDSFASPDCVTDTPPPVQANQSSSSSSSVGIIIGAVAAAAIVFILLLIIVVVIIVMYRRHKSTYSVDMVQQQKHTNEYVITNSLTTGVRDHPVGRSTASSKNRDIRMDIKPADNKEDPEYDVIQSNNGDIEMYKNSSCAEAKFT